MSPNIWGWNVENVHDEERRCHACLSVLFVLFMFIAFCLNNCRTTTGVRGHGDLLDDV